MVINFRLPFTFPRKRHDWGITFQRDNDGKTGLDVCLINDKSICEFVYVHRGYLLRLNGFNN